MKDKRYYTKVFLLFTDLIFVDLACKFAYFINIEPSFKYQDPYLSFFVIFSLLWMITSLFFGVYGEQRIFDFRHFSRNIFGAVLLHMVLLGFYMFSVQVNYIPRDFLLYAYAFAISTVILYRFLVIRAYTHYNSLTYHMRRIVVVGTDGTAEDLYQFFNDKETTVSRFVAIKDEWLQDVELNRELIHNKLGELKQYCLEGGIKEIYLSLPLTSLEMINELSDFADDNFIYFRIVTDFGVLEQKQVDVDFFGHIPILSLRKAPLKGLFNRILKRLLDIVFSSLVILLIFPWLYPIIALLIKMESEGPVIFKQKRSGRENKEFLCFKFRTMTVNKDSDAKQATKSDSRITKIGAFLRKTSLDEFPQFVNVFLGQMSVVGPRPHMLKHTEEYSQIIEKFLFRHFIRPGITGWAQVNGYRGGTEDNSLMQKRIEHDAWYIENWSVLLDLRIIFLTVWNIVKGEENAY